MCSINSFLKALINFILELFLISLFSNTIIIIMGQVCTKNQQTSGTTEEMVRLNFEILFSLKKSLDCCSLEIKAKDPLARQGS